MFNVTDPFYVDAVPLCPAVTDPAVFTGLPFCVFLISLSFRVQYEVEASRLEGAGSVH